MTNHVMRSELVNAKRTNLKEHTVVVPNRDARPLYDSFDRQGVQGKELSASIARNMEDLSIVFAIRASAYFSDEQHSYEKHFEGNDFSATHVIGWIGREPVATLRIRYFADFARIERIAVRPTHRRSRISFKIVQAAFAFCRDKGYKKISGVAREEMVPFWSMFGGHVNKGREPLFIYGLEHYEMSIEFPPQETAVSSLSHPLVLLRPEGRWHEAGQLDRAPKATEEAEARPAPQPAVVAPAPASTPAPVKSIQAPVRSSRTPRTQLKPRLATRQQPAQREHA
jgi:predicted GNAT family N-acyltransferase